jgi:hypothetical protein
LQIAEAPAAARRERGWARKAIPYPSNVRHKVTLRCTPFDISYVMQRRAALR